MKQDLAALQAEPWVNPNSFLKHFRTMMGTYGLYEHATIQGPLLQEGYCTDDNARAVHVLLRLAQHLPAEAQPNIDELVAGCWQYISDAREAPGVFRNLRTAEGDWLIQDISDDMYARLLRALTAVIGTDFDEERRQAAVKILDGLIPKIKSLTAPRALAEVIIGLAALSEEYRARLAVSEIIEANAKQLVALWEQNADGTWQWFEEKMVYANALLPHSLLVARRILGHSDFDTVIEKSTAFLIASTIRNGVFIPIGSVGWYPKGGTPSQENQQPIEAGTMVDFLVDFESDFPGRFPAEILVAPYLWFFGANTGNTKLADREIGASLDGLFDKGPNPNLGAESMLAYLWAEIRIRDFSPDVRNRAFAARDMLLHI